MNSTVQSVDAGVRIAETYTSHLVNKELSLHCVALELKNPSHMIFGGVEGHVRITLSLPLKLSGIVTFFTPK